MITHSRYLDTHHTSFRFALFMITALYHGHLRRTTSRGVLISLSDIYGVWFNIGRDIPIYDGHDIRQTGLFSILCFVCCLFGSSSVERTSFRFAERFVLRYHCFLLQMRLRCILPALLSGVLRSSTRCTTPFSCHRKEGEQKMAPSKVVSGTKRLVHAAAFARRDEKGFGTRDYGVPYWKEKLRSMNLSGA